MKPLALLDLDNTLVDYDTAIQRDLKLLETPGERYDYDSVDRLPHIKERVRFIRRNPGWWLNLAKLPAGFAMLNVFRELGCELHVLTRAPASCPNACSEKVMWVNNNLPGVETTTTARKDLFRGDILFDDWPEYILPWLANNPKGLVVMPDWRWNKNLVHDRVVRYTWNDTSTNLPFVREWLKMRMEEQSGLFNRLRKMIGR